MQHSGCFIRGNAILDSHPAALGASLEKARREVGKSGAARRAQMLCGIISETGA
jgi:hypothetical protein